MRQRQPSRAVVALVALLLAASMVACAEDGDSAGSSTTAVSRKDRKAARAGDDGEGGGRAKECARPGPPGERSAQTRRISDAGPAVDAVAYPTPDYTGQPWSQWGQGIVLRDGRYFSAIGDHCGVNGNSYFFEYDPETSRLRMVADVLSATEHVDGAWGYGKIHAQLVEGADGGVYAATYWGQRRGLVYEKGYEGDRLLRLDPDSGDLTDLGVPVPKHGLPSLAGLRRATVIYGEAADPTADGLAGAFFAYDIESGEIVFETDDGAHDGFRNVLVNGDAAYYAAGAGRLRRYADEEGVEDGPGIPGDILRASTQPASDGTTYGATRDPDGFFALRPDGGVEKLGAARGYAASIAVDPGGDRFFYVPYAAGKAWTHDAPVMEVDTRTGEEKALVELGPIVEKALGYRLSGSYNVAVSPDGERLYVGWNAGKASEEREVGAVVLTVIHL